MKRTPTDYALFLLSQRDRSTGEIRQKMRQRKISESEIKKIINFLIDKKFLDDERFAKNYIQNQISFKPQGKISLIQKLFRYKVDKDIIESVTAEIIDGKEEELVKEAAKKWMKRYGEISDFKKKERLMRHLLSRGFNYDTIITILNTNN